MKEGDIMEILNLLKSDRLFSSRYPEALPESAEVIRDLEFAMILENEQDLPTGYRIWSDVKSSAISEFRSKACFSEAMVEIEPVEDEIWESCESVFLVDLRKKELRKNQTKFEDFFATVINDVGEDLKMIAAANYCHGSEVGTVFQSMLDVFQAGFYPCGWRDEGRIVCFDPSVLDGHRENPFSDLSE